VRDVAGAVLSLSVRVRVLFHWQIQVADLPGSESRRARAPSHDLNAALEANLALSASASATEGG
jgi:hypothetical protein